MHSSILLEHAAGLLLYRGLPLSRVEQTLAIQLQARFSEQTIREKVACLHCFQFLILELRCDLYSARNMCIMMKSYTVQNTSGEHQGWKRIRLVPIWDPDFGSTVHIKIAPRIVGPLTPRG